MKGVVIIVGAGPSGLATSACLNLLSVPNILLEREDCAASLWKHRAYDRLSLHLAKQFCQLPHLPFPPTAPTFIPRLDFVRYLEEYVERFGLRPRCGRCVESAEFDGVSQTWMVRARNAASGEVEVYEGPFLVLATGENGEGFIPKVEGLGSFPGEVVHSSQYKTGSKYEGKSVLVVGSGNSGMEIAYDLSNNGAKSSIVVRSPVHVSSKRIIYLGMVLIQYLPVHMVDSIVVMLGELVFGDLSKYGIPRPEKGPFYLKKLTGRSPVIDVGAVEKIKSKEITVLPAITSIEGDEVAFANGKVQKFDAIVFATGYKTTAHRWLKDDDHFLNEDGLPKKAFPNHWKGKNGLYCAGFGRMGLAAISLDAQNIAKDIKSCYKEEDEDQHY